MKLASFLMLKGFVLFDVEDNKKCEGRKVYVFNDSEAIRKAIESYSIATVLKIKTYMESIVN
jgi:hypothetical protein